MAWNPDRNIGRDIPVGQILESEIARTARAYYLRNEIPAGQHGKNAIKKIFKCSIGEKDDLLSGIDIEIMQIPIDITCNYAGKDNMIDTGTYIDLDVRWIPEMKLRFGIRTGNSHAGYTGFDRPVIVMGFDAGYDAYGNTAIIKKEMDSICSAFGRKIPDIADIASDIYFRYTDDLEAGVGNLIEPDTTPPNPALKSDRAIEDTRLTPSMRKLVDMVRRTDACDDAEHIKSDTERSGIA